MNARGMTKSRNSLCTGELPSGQEAQRCNSGGMLTGGCRGEVCEREKLLRRHEEEVVDLSQHCIEEDVSPPVQHPYLLLVGTQAAH
jgi:hypothetical protein